MLSTVIPIVYKSVHEKSITFKIAKFTVIKPTIKFDYICHISWSVNWTLKLKQFRKERGKIISYLLIGIAINQELLAWWLENKIRPVLIQNIARAFHVSHLTAEWEPWRFAATYDLRPSSAGKSATFTLNIKTDTAAFQSVVLSLCNLVTSHIVSLEETFNATCFTRILPFTDFRCWHRQQ